ncbi:MAG: hypothetical protein JXA42_13310 [Anaerolineales bacterium]|nr:hypothetical protein [Anaerolineales bacterium]
MKEQIKSKTGSKQQTPIPIHKFQDNQKQQPPVPADLVQRARIEPDSLTPQDIQRLGQTIGNQAVVQLLAAGASPSSKPGVASIQKDDTTSTNITETTDTGNKYTQELVLNKTKSTIKIYLGVNWIKKGTWASDAAFQKFIRKVKTSAYDMVDNKFKIVCKPTDPKAGKTNIELPIEFVIYDIGSGYDIEAHGGTPGGGSAMGTKGGKLYEYDSDGTLEIPQTFAHEFGHAMLGASDEYANPKVPGRVLTNDHSIMANYYVQGKDKAEFKARHFEHILKEVAKAFAGYTCSIKSM